MTEGVVLSVNDLSVNFGGLKALNGVNFELRKGEVLGLIGPNGAGKTTVFNALCGIVTPDSGSLSLNGKEIKWPKPHKLAKLKIARTLQGVGLFPDLTVYDNVMIGANKFAESGLLRAAFGTKSESTISNIEKRFSSSCKLLTTFFACFLEPLVNIIFFPGKFFISLLSFSFLFI